MGEETLPPHALSRASCTEPSVLANELLYCIDTGYFIPYRIVIIGADRRIVKHFGAGAGGASPLARHLRSSSRCSRKPEPSDPAKENNH